MEFNKTLNPKEREDNKSMSRDDWKFKEFLNIKFQQKIKSFHSGIPIQSER